MQEEFQYPGYLGSKIEYGGTSKYAQHPLTLNSNGQTPHGLFLRLINVFWRLFHRLAIKVHKREREREEVGL